MKFPVDFVEKFSSPSVGEGYPVQISASDLMKNFHKAAMVVSDTEIQPFKESDKTVGDGMIVRSLKFDPAPPIEQGTYVFGFKDGVFTWIATEEC